PTQITVTNEQITTIEVVKTPQPVTPELAANTVAALTDANAAPQTATHLDARAIAALRDATRALREEDEVVDPGLELENFRRVLGAMAKKEELKRHLAELQSEIESCRDDDDETDLLAGDDEV
ncbi:MAG: hypothetical protein N2383_03415, partial [Caldilineales bacterium]|nr:hypothetical protein [Caldilineales bacterium]